MKKNQLTKSVIIGVASLAAIVIASHLGYIEHDFSYDLLDFRFWYRGLIIPAVTSYLLHRFVLTKVEEPTFLYWVTIFIGFPIAYTAVDLISFICLIIIGFIPAFFGWELIGNSNMGESNTPFDSNQLSLTKYVHCIVFYSFSILWAYEAGKRNKRRGSY